MTVPRVIPRPELYCRGALPNRFKGSSPVQPLGPQTASLLLPSCRGALDSPEVKRLFLSHRRPAAQKLVGGRKVEGGVRP